ncbi:MAG: tRNA-dihydrouridine synthase family protein, partial [Oscillospiraceae bacterium]|nr:tRNA-dihydrouridine synthase family protein [Oscillospiraceae bacterium]
MAEYDCSGIAKNSAGLFENAVALAPMAGAADSAFRLMAMEFGASFCVSEMVSVKALLFNDRKTALLMEHSDREKPFGIQLFGYCADDFRKAAAIAEKTYHADFIDINMGCPVPKIVSSGAGSALMREPKRASDIVK